MFREEATISSNWRAGLLMAVAVLFSIACGPESVTAPNPDSVVERLSDIPVETETSEELVLECDDCPKNFKCVHGACVCFPNCDGKVCGTNGCGGSCGDCLAGDKCEEGSCVAPPKCPEGSPCDDGLVCTSDDTCHDDVCAGVPVVCDDGLECTLDSCDGEGECTATLMPGSCLIEGECFAGGSNHPESPCLECIWSYAPEQWLPADSNPCDDNDLCTLGDHCLGGICVASQTVDCTDGIQCTIDVCDAVAGCLNEPFVGTCDDGDACTGDDLCQESGECEGELLSCNDDNVCTEDSCDAKIGCLHIPVGGKCDDGDNCTIGDQCSQGICLPGPGVPQCDDSNQCTNDYCLAAVGCVNQPIGGLCDDENVCTVGDQCVQGECAPGPAKVCDDGNPCTDQSCDAVVGCLFVDNSAPCDDSNPCTISDKCQGGKCTAGLTGLDCGDGNPCTSDLCNPILGCVYLYNSVPCDDANECTVNDTCMAGKCGGAVLKCDDFNVCTNDYCDPFVDGGCVHLANVLPCDEGDPCSLGDHCVEGNCISGDGKPACNDNNPCTDDGCEPKAGCVHLNIVAWCDDGNSCTDKDYCAGGSCVGGIDACTCLNDADCVPFDDGDLCNGTLWCDASSPDPKAWSCKAKSGSEVNCDHTKDTPCLVAHCIQYTGQCQMVPVNQDEDCDDGNQCSVNDHCESGSCVGGGNVSCDDGNVCTTDSCNPQVGCMHKPHSDGTPCQGGGWLCQGGQCLPCDPDCLGKECGADGCGGSCGTCGEEQVCQATLCVDVGLMACQGPLLPSYATCGDIGEEGCCNDGRAISCLFDQLFCIDCPSLGLECGWNGDAGSYECLPKGGRAPNNDPPIDCQDCVPPCQDGYDCINGECIACQPQCAGKDCGADGCGGQCGYCAPDEICQAGECVVPGLLAECKGAGTPSLDTCVGIDYVGCCDSSGRVLWCEGGKLYCIDCAASNPECGWSAGASFYDCGTDGFGDPSGAHPKACAECIPPCFPGTTCVDGNCVECNPTCWGKECGDDGCGGLCGTCPGGTQCENGDCISISQCGDITPTGECQGNTVVWCQDNQLHEHLCVGGTVCAYIPSLGKYGCQANCPGVPLSGKCEGTVLVTCELAGVMEVDCADFGMGCGWDDDVDQYACVNGCGDLDWIGQCDGTVLSYCDSPIGYGGDVVVVDCADYGMICDHVSPTVGYDCVDPCEGASLFGACDGDVLTYCDSKQWPPAVVVVDCGAEGKKCALADPVTGYACIQSGNGDNTVSGTITFDRQTNTANGYGNVSPVPASLIKVSVWDTKGTVSVTDDSLLASGKTDEFGNYSLTFGGGGNDAYVAAYAWWDDQGVAHYVNIADSWGWDDGDTVAVNSVKFTPQSQTLLPFNISRSQGAGAFNILARLMDGRLFAKEHMGTPPAVWVKWDGPSNNYCWSGSYYSPMEQYIHIGSCSDDGDEYDDSVILHEYGHHVSSTLSQDDNPGGPHWVTYDVDPRMAWSEGFATFFGQAVIGSPVYLDATEHSALVYDLEGATDLCPASSYLGMKQDICEALVGGALWDIHDNPQESYDVLAMGPEEILEVVAGYLADPTNSDRGVVGADFVDFLDGWFCSGYEQYFGLYKLIVTALKFPYDFAGPCGEVPNPLHLRVAVLEHRSGRTVIEVEATSGILLEDVDLAWILPHGSRLAVTPGETLFTLLPGMPVGFHFELEVADEPVRVVFSATAQPHPALRYGTSASAWIGEAGALVPRSR